MDYSIDIVVFAPLAPILGVLLLWFIQLLFIQSEKFLLGRIKPKHESLCKFTNFLGILFQTICHALGYTVTRSGISDFIISVDYGKVAPKKEKKGVFEWISNAFLFLGPFFIPSLLLLICLFFLMNGGFEIVIPSNLIEPQYSFIGQITIFFNSVYNFTTSFFNFILNIDLLHPGHFGFLLLLIFLGMGMRPSYIGEKKKEKIDILYDLKNVWHLLSFKPLYIIIFLVAAYLFFHISIFFNQMWYVQLFSIFALLSIISIVAIIISELILFLVLATDHITGKSRFLPYVSLPASYLLARLMFYFFPMDFSITASFIIMIVFTFIVTIILLKYKTNKFKTEKKMKILRGKDVKKKSRKRWFARKRND